MQIIYIHEREEVFLNLISKLLSYCFQSNLALYIYIVADSPGQLIGTLKLFETPHLNRNVINEIMCKEKRSKINKVGQRHKLKT